MSDGNWQVFVRNADDGPRLISVDSIAPDPGRRWRVDVVVVLRRPQANGFPKGDENKEIEGLVDALAGRLGETALVAKVAGGGKKELLFQIARGDVGAVVRQQSAATLPGHDVSCDVVEDAAWERHRELLPTRCECKQIDSRQILDVLRSHGDPLTARRPVKHWAYFRDEASRERAAVDLGSQGFSIESKDRLETLHGDRPYSLRFARDEVPDTGSVAAFVELAFDLCDSAGGEYDGWETQVIANEPPAPLSSKRGLFGRLFGR